MLSQSNMVNAQVGEVVSSIDQLSQDLTVKLGSNNIILKDSSNVNLLRLNMSGEELMYETYNQANSTWGTAVSATPAFGQGFLELYSTTTPSSASTISGFVSGISRGSGMSFSQANQEVTLEAGTYMIEGYAELTFTGTTGEFTWFPHDVAQGTTIRLGSPSDLYSWASYPATTTGEKSSSVVPIYFQSGSQVVIDFRADLATAVESAEYLAVMITKIA